MSTSYSKKLQLVKKNNSWVPQKKVNQTLLESHGIVKGPKLGEGAYAKVYLGESRKHNNKKLAIKVIDKFKAPKDFLSKFLDREVSIMKRLQHPNVVCNHSYLKKTFRSISLRLFFKKGLKIFVAFVGPYCSKLYPRS